MSSLTVADTCPHCPRTFAVQASRGQETAVQLEAALDDLLAEHLQRKHTTPARRDPYDHPGIPPWA